MRLARDAAGQVWVYSPDAGEWISAERNRPLTTGDRLSTDRSARAEVRVGSTVVRLDSNSELEVLRLDDDRLRLQLHRGSSMVRLRDSELAAQFEMVTAEGRFRTDRAGAYRFEIAPGQSHVMEIDAALYPRRKIERLGIAPGTSMYQTGENDRRLAYDYRPEIHDSDGLQMWTGAGEWIWRPLVNPTSLRVNSFLDNNPRGFGLMQRDQNFDHYQDDGAFYDLRPSLWVEPKGDWGKGSVQLVEIPTSDETFDNMVAFWNPEKKPQPGEELLFAYRLHWSDASTATGVARVISTEVGMAPETDRLRRFDIAFEADAALPAGTLKPDVWSVGGQISNIRVARDGERRARLRFDLEPGAASVVELHAALTHAPMGGETSQLTETWLFRWTPE